MNPLRFIQEVRTEVRRVVWPSRRETFISTIIVLLLAALASALFLLADQFFAWAIKSLLAIR